MNKKNQILEENVYHRQNKKLKSVYFQNKSLPYSVCVESISKKQKNKRLTKLKLSKAFFTLPHSAKSSAEIYV